MEKQHFTSEVARLVNPPLLPHFKQLQQDYLESVYSSKKAHLGRTKSSEISKAAMKKGFGILTKRSDSAAIPLYPSNSRITRSSYGMEFLPPESYNTEKIRPAGVKMKSYDNSGGQMKKVFSETGNTSFSVIVPLSSSCKENQNKKLNTECKLHYIPLAPADEDKNETSNEQKFLNNQRNLLSSLRKLLNLRNPSQVKDFSTFIKSYLQVYPECITLNDLQEIIQNFGYCVPLAILQKLLIDCNIINSEDTTIYVLKLMNALNKKSVLSEGFKVESNLSFCGDLCLDHFKTSSSVIGDHKYSVTPRTAGIPNFRTDIKKPKLQSVSDFTEYGDIKSSSYIIQPNIFVKYGVDEEDLKILRSKEEILSILHESGIQFQKEIFENVWKIVNKQGKASIGNIWNSLKHLCLIKNKLFSN